MTSITHPSDTHPPDALYLACIHHNYKLIKSLLISSNANSLLSYIDPITHNTPLQISIINDLSPTIIITMINSGHSLPSNINSNSDTALILACNQATRTRFYKIAAAIINTTQSNPSHVNLSNKTALIIVLLDYLPRFGFITDICLDVALALINTGDSNPSHIFNNMTALTIVCFYNVYTAIPSTHDLHDPDFLDSLDSLAIAIINTNQSIPSFISSKGSAIYLSCNNNHPKVALAILNTGASFPIDDIYRALIDANHYNMTQVVPILQNIINGSNPIPISSNRNIRLNDKLPISSANTIRFKKSHSIYDPITMNDTNIISFLSLTNDNIAIFFINKWTLISRSQLTSLINTNNNSIVYSCHLANGLPNQTTNVNTRISYFNLRSIGLFDYCPLVDITKIIHNTHQYFRLEATSKSLLAVVSDSVLNHRGSWVSANHCQDGSGGKVYKILRTFPHIITHDHLTPSPINKTIRHTSSLSSISKSHKKKKINKSKKKLHSI